MGTARIRRRSPGERPDDTGAFARLRGFGPRSRRAVGGEWAVGAILVGFLAEDWGVGGALVLGAVGYGPAVLALFGLPETRGEPV